ncbi:MAG: hypothetical protein M1342_00630 [Patescibacteria group bacterium]|nr:hypothetical protein [Patescibacteria group bacterium]
MNNYQETQRACRLAALKQEMDGKLERDFPKLYKDESVLIETPSTRIAVDDLSWKARQSIAEALEFLFVACSGEIVSYDVRRQGQKLVEKLVRLMTVLDRKKTLAIFPGDGAQAVKEQLPEKLLSGLMAVDLPVRREVDARTKTVKGVTVADVTKIRKLIADGKFNTFLVLDDVIATGATASAIRAAFPVKNGQWYAGSLLMLSPLQNRSRAAGPSGLAGYGSIIAPTVYQGTAGIPAVNSVSTLIGTSEKSVAVRNRYINDFVIDQPIFTEMVQQLRQMVPEKGQP